MEADSTAEREEPFLSEWLVQIGVCRATAATSAAAGSGLLVETAGLLYWFCCTTRIIPGRKLATFWLLRLSAATVVL